jgi:hypothetical protein
MLKVRTLGVALGGLAMMMLPAMASADCGACGQKATCGQKTACGSPCQPACKPANTCKPAKCKTVCKTDPCDPCKKTMVTVCEKPGADIEALKAINPKCSTDLCIGYQVDVQRTCDEFDLLVQVKHCKNVVYQKLIHLDTPYRTDKDGDRHFHGSLSDQLSEVISADRGTLQVVGYVIPRSANGDIAARLDRERESVHESNKTLFGIARIPSNWPSVEMTRAEG